MDQPKVVVVGGGTGGTGGTDARDSIPRHVIARREIDLATCIFLVRIVTACELLIQSEAIALYFVGTVREICPHQEVFALPATFPLGQALAGAQEEPAGEHNRK